MHDQNALWAFVLLNMTCNKGHEAEPIQDDHEWPPEMQSFLDRMEEERYGGETDTNY